MYQKLLGLFGSLKKRDEQAEKYILILINFLLVYKGIC